MKQEKDYFAFISYQRKDEEWADRLRSEFEHYRLSSSIRKQNASLPKEIRPIFRDVRELAGGVLAKWYYKDIEGHRDRFLYREWVDNSRNKKNVVGYREANGIQDI